MGRGFSAVAAGVRVAAAVVAVLVLGPTRAEAQNSGDPSRWGVAFSLVPKWTIPTGDSALATLAELVVAGVEDGGGVNVESRDFRIGLVRGRRLGGEWGVSFVHRSYKDGSTQGSIREECFGTGTETFCSLRGPEYVYQGVTLSGVEINKFISFVTIKNIVQIGLDVAGGVGTLSGTATKRNVEFVNGQQLQTIVTSQVAASELYEFDPELMGRIEVGAGVTLPYGIKARITGGFNYPGTHTFSFTASYLFGVGR